MEQVYCRYCGKLIDEDAQFCTYCGKAQEVQGIDLAKSSQSDDSKTGAAINHPKKPLLSPNAKKWLKRLSKILLTLVIIGAVVAGGIFGYNWYEDYLYEKKVDEAIVDIVTKLNSDNDSLKIEYSANVLYSYGHWWYKDEVLYENISWDYGSVSAYDISKHLDYGVVEQAFNILEKNAKEGNGRSQFILGQVYYSKSRISEDVLTDSDLETYIKFHNDTELVRAAYWWNEAVISGYYKACNNLGWAYENGFGVDRDMVKAAVCYKIGAEYGEDYAQVHYGELFRDGIVVQGDTLVPRDIEQAKYWWRKAADQGNKNAEDLLQVVYD